MRKDGYPVVAFAQMRIGRVTLFLFFRSGRFFFVRGAAGACGGFGGRWELTDRKEKDADGLSNMQRSGTWNGSCLPEAYGEVRGKYVDKSACLRYDKFVNIESALGGFCDREGWTTIYDIADKAGCVITTVSRGLGRSFSCKFENEEQRCDGAR
jgi:hypothetical protein